MYATVTSKGTTTIPSSLRKQLNIREGSMLEFSVSKSGELIIKLPPSVQEIHALSRKVAKRSQPKKLMADYKTGDGFRQHIRDNASHYEPQT